MPKSNRERAAILHCVTAMVARVETDLRDREAKAVGDYGALAEIATERAAVMARAEAARREAQGRTVTRAIARTLAGPDGQGADPPAAVAAHLTAAAETVGGLPARIAAAEATLADVEKPKAAERIAGFLDAGDVEAAERELAAVAESLAARAWHNRAEAVEIAMRSPSVRITGDEALRCANALTAARTEHGRDRMAKAEERLAEAEAIILGAAAAE